MILIYLCMLLQNAMNEVKMHFPLNSELIFPLNSELIDVSLVSLQCRSASECISDECLQDGYTMHVCRAGTHTFSDKKILFNLKGSHSNMNS